MKLDKYFLFSWRKMWLIVVIGFISIVLHNVISGLFNVEEALFFIITIFVIPIYFLIVLIYTLVYHIRKKLKK